MQAALQHMHTELGARRVLAEGGAILNGALIEGGYVDELLLTLSPKVIGGPSQSPAVRWEAPSSRDAIGGPSQSPAVRWEAPSSRDAIRNSGWRPPWSTTGPSLRPASSSSVTQASTP